MKGVKVTAEQFQKAVADKATQMLTKTALKNTVKAKWSAYNFLFLKGPSPLSMFFSFKRLTIENIYSKEVVARLNGNEIN